MNRIIFLLLLFLIGCSKTELDEIPTPIGGGDNTEVKNPYEKFSVNYTKNSIINRVPILFKNMSQHDFIEGNQWPADFAILDYNNDGYYDFVGGGSSFDASYAGIEERNPFVFYTGDSEGNLTYDSVNSQKFTSLIHGTFAVVNDFNRDGNLDIFFAGSGFDKPGGPCCEYPILLENDGNGSFIQIDFPNAFGYWHSVTTGDVNHNGIIDIVLTSPKPNSGTPSYIIEFVGGSYQLIEWNNGFDDYSKTFGKFTVEVIDLDNDGLDDVIYGGTEYNNSQFHQETWSPSFVKFSNENIALIPNEGYETTMVSDIQVHDIDNDGDLDLFLLRTYWGNPNKINYIQIVRNDGDSFVDITEENVLSYLPGEVQIARIIITDSDSDGIFELRHHTLMPQSYSFTDFTFLLINGKLIKK